MLLMTLFIFGQIYFFPKTVGQWHLEKNACSHLIDYLIKNYTPNCYENLNVLSSTLPKIRQNGYNVEIHDVVTDDGYRLQIFRIPVRDNDNRKKKQPIILQHGIMVNSDVWTWMGSRSLAFVLADSGYDVWLANQRDSDYTTHNIYKTSDYNFWNTSIDTVAAYDVPAILKTVAIATNKSGSIIYIGHSRGSTVLFMYASENPKKAQNFLRGFIALSPITYLEPAFHVRRLIDAAPIINKILQMLKKPVLFCPAETTIPFYQNLCTHFPHVCKLLLESAFGRTFQLLPDDLLAFFSIYPASVSVMHLLQFSQITKSGKFQKFDYGKVENMLKYKQKQPPLYNLSNLKVPTYMFYGEHDVLIKETTVKRVFKELGSSEKAYFKIPIKTKDDKWQFGHIDFVWPKNIRQFFYKDLFKVLDKLQPK